MREHEVGGTGGGVDDGGNVPAPGDERPDPQRTERLLELVSMGEQVTAADRPSRSRLGLDSRDPGLLVEAERTSG